MSLLYALTGSFDARGGNVLFAAAPAAPITGEDLPSAKVMAPAVGRVERPLGPARWGYVGARDLYQAILEGVPYQVGAVLGFGANMLLAHADGRYGREALKALDFYAHVDMFMNPTAELADVVLPVASAFEREGLKIGFEVDQDARAAAGPPAAGHGHRFRLGLTTWPRRQAGKLDRVARGLYALPGAAMSEHRSLAEVPGSRMIHHPLQ
jgi:anaerobic selenocysteine-containing dehydrogenase